MVLDPYLENHLKHWGIDMSELRKTDKSVAELSIELQKTFDWTRVSECSSPLYGPGFTGIENLGNTCYMASVLQTLFTIPEFQDRYYANAQRFFRESNNPPKDFHVQMSKVADGLLSGEHSRPVEKPSEELSYTPYVRYGNRYRHFIDNRT
jgi:ubiquitin carboxyl-terminal hydrolase 5/13